MYTFTVRASSGEIATSSYAHPDRARIERKAAAVAATLSGTYMIDIQRVGTNRLGTYRVSVAHYTPNLYRRTSSALRALRRFADVLTTIDSQYTPEEWPPYSQVIRNAFNAARAAAFTLSTPEEIVYTLRAIDNIREQYKEV